MARGLEQLTNMSLREWVSEFNEEAVLADGFDEAFLGMVERYGISAPVALYDKDKCFQILVDRDGMTYEEAVEYFDFNVIGAWVGEYTPMFLNVYPDMRQFLDTVVYVANRNSTD